jgi:hypothetical protein
MSITSTIVSGLQIFTFSPESRIRSSVANLCVVDFFDRKVFA